MTADFDETEYRIKLVIFLIVYAIQHYNYLRKQHQDKSDKLFNSIIFDPIVPSPWC